MATYLRPGVFVEETLQALTDPALDSNDSIAAFVGTSSKGGPLGPVLVTSWSQYQALFGSIRGGNDDLAFSVFSFFNNGGAQAYVTRAVQSGSTAASLSLLDADSDGAGSDTAEATLTVTATSPGTWASSTTSSSRIFVTVVPSLDPDRFDFTVEVGQGSGLLAREQFTDLSLDPGDARYAIATINSPTVGSKYVSLTKVGTYGDDVTTGTNGNPAAVTRAPLTGGSDGTGSPDLGAALRRLDVVDSILTVNFPGVTDADVLEDALAWAEAEGNRFIVIDAPEPGPNDTAEDITTDGTTFVASLPPSSYGAVYGPWIYANDPSSGVPGALRLVPPGGSVLGQYVRTDVTRGVWKAPAGTETGLRVVQVGARFTNDQLDALNQSGYNVIRSVPGAGFCVMGARTLSKGTPDRYVNIRRNLIYIKRSLVGVTRFAIFEPNEEDTWDNIAAQCSQFLTTLWQSGGLQGDTPDQAFFVKCDEDNNDAQSVNSGVVNIDVGVALSAPAEFIVIRIGQFDGGSNVTEDGNI